DLPGDVGSARVPNDVRALGRLERSARLAFEDDRLGRRDGELSSHGQRGGIANAGLARARGQDTENEEQRRPSMERDARFESVRLRVGWFAGALTALGRHGACLLGPPPATT